MSLSFAGFKPVTKTNTRTNVTYKREQKFDLKFRKYDSKKGGKTAEESAFQISDKMFDEMGLETSGLMQINDANGVPFLAVVDNDNATILKRTAKLKDDAAKGRKFKSTILEEALVASGLIDASVKGANQLVSLKKEAENVAIGESGLQASAVYSLSKDENNSPEEAGDENDAVVEEEVVEDNQATAESAPVVESNDSDDDF